MSDIIVDFSQYTSDTTLNGAYNASDNVTLADDSSILDALTDAQIDSLAANNVDTISATDGVLSWNADQFAHFILGNVAIDPDTFAIMADSGADISALTATQIGEIAAKGVATIDPTDSMLTFSVDQFTALGAMSVDASADFTIADTGAHLAGMSAGAIAALGSLTVDRLDATDNVLSLNLAQYQALGTVTLTAGDDVTLADTSAHLQTLTSSDLGNLGSNGIDHIDATDNVLTISVAGFNALGSVTLTQSDIVTLADTGATISSFSTGNIDALAAGGIDVFDATDNAISFTVAQYNETVTDNIALTVGDTVTLADSGATLSLLTAAEINNLVNVDAVNATDNTLVIAVDQYEAFVGNNITLGPDDAVTISDTAANLGTLDFPTLAAANVDQLNSTTPFTNLTAANLAALGTVIFSGASSVTLTDTGANIAAVTDFSTFAAHGVDTLDASDNALTISEAQFQALGTTTLTGSDTVTISDTAANIVGAANYATLAAAGIDFLNATTPINITINNLNSLGTVAFTAGSAVTLRDTGAHIALVANFATFASHGVDSINASDNTLTISAAQYGALGAVTLTAGDSVTISDTAAHLSGLTFSTLAGANVDFLDATDAYTNLTVQNMTDLGAVHFTAASNVTLTDSAGNIQGVSDFSTYAAHGVDTIKSTDDQLSLTVSQFSGLGTTHLTGSDAIYLEDTATNLTAYLDSAGTQTALSTNGVDVVYATGGSMSVTAAEFSVVYGAGAVFSGPESVTLADTGANIAALDFTTLAAMGIDRIDASDNALTVTVAQYLDIAGAVAFTAADTVTISDTAAHVEALTAGQIGALSTHLIDAVSVTSGGDLDWSVAQWQALPGGVSLSDPGYALVVDDSETTLEGLTGAQLGALAASGAQELASTEGVLNLSVSQAEGFLGTGLSIVLGDAATLSDAGTAIAGMTALQIGQLAAAGFDTIDASDNTLTLSVAQFSALGAVTLAGADAVTLADTANNLNTYLHGNVFSALSSNDVNTIHATEGAISIDAQVVNNVAASGAAFASGDNVTLSDTGANIAALNFSVLPALNVDTIDASDGVLNISLAQFEAIAGTVALTIADNITVTGLVENLSTAEIASFAANNVDHLINTPDFLQWSVAQWNALTPAVTVDNALHYIQNFVVDTAADLSAVSATQIANFVTEGAELWLSIDSNTVTWDVAKLEAMGSSSFSSLNPAPVVISDTAVHLEAVSDYSIFAGHGVNTIFSSDGSLSLTVAQFEGLNGTVVDSGTALTLADTASNLTAYLEGDSAHGALSLYGVDFIHASEGTWSLDAQAISNVTGTGAVFTSADTVTLADTGDNIAALDFSVLPGLHVDTIDASDDVLNISLTQYEAIAGTVGLTGADDVTVTGSLNFLSTAEIASFATNQVDHLLNNSNLIWTVAQWNALTTAVTIDTVVHLPNGNYVLDSGANLSTVTATQIANFVTEGAEVWYSADPGFVFWNVANLEAMGTSRFDPSTTSVIVDTAANLEAVSDYSIFVSHGISAISASGGSLALTVAQFAGLGVTAVDGSNTLTIADTAGNLSAYLDGAGVSTALSANGVDFIHATGGTLSVDAQAISNVNGTGAVFTPGDIVTLSDTGAHIAALDFSVLHTLNVDTIDATDNVLNISLGQYDDIKGVVALTVADDVTVTGNLDSLSTVEIASFATNHVDHLLDDDSFGDVVWSVAQWGALTTAVTIDSVAHDGRNFVADNAADLGAVTATQIADFVTEGAEVWALSSGTVTWDVAKLEAMGASHWSIASTVTISDTAANLEAVSDFSIFAAHGIDMIDSTDNTLSLTVAQFNGLGTTTLTGADVVTLADTASDLAAYLDGNDANSALAINGVDFIHATGGTLSVDAQAISNLNGTGTVFTPGDTVILSDTGANIATLDFSVLHTLNVDTIDASDDVLNISLAQYQAIAGTVALTVADDVTVTGNLDGLFAFQIATFAANHVDHLLDDDGNGAVFWSVAQWNALTTAVTIDNAGHIANSNYVMDSATDLNAVTATQIANFVTEGAEVWAASDFNTVTWDVAKLEAMGSSIFYASSPLYISDTAANLEAVSDYSIFSSHFVDTIFCTDPGLSLTVAQFEGLNGIFVDSSTALTLADTAENLAAYLDGASAHGALSLYGVDFIHATGGTLSVDASAISNVTGTGAVFTPGDTVTLFDTGDNIAALDFSVLHALNVDTIDASDNVLNISLTQYEAIAGTVALTVADYVTVTGNLDSLSTTEIAGFAANHVDHLVDDDGGSEVIWTVGQWDALTTAVTIDNIKQEAGLNLVFDTAASLSAATAAQIANFTTEGAEVWRVNDFGTVTWNMAQLEAMGASVWHATTVVISDTAASLELVSDYSIFANHGVTTISASDTNLSLTADQFRGLGNVGVDVANTFTLADTAANIEAMGSHGYAAMAGKGVDFVHATDGSLTVTYAELNAIFSSGTVFTAADHVTLTGSQAELFDSQTPAYLSALGTQFHIDEISLTGGSGHLDVGQWNGLVAGSVSLDSANTIALMDTAATLAGEDATAIAAMAGQIDSWAVSDSNTLALSEAQLNALSTATVALTQSDTVELADTESNIEALFSSALAAYIAQGVDIIHATGGTLNVNVSQVEAVIATTATFFGGDNVTLLSSSGLLSGLAVSDIAKLAAANVDHIFTTDILYWSKAQFDALGTVTITSAASGIYLVDSEATLEALTVSDIAHYASLEIGHFIVTGQSDLNYSVAQALQIAASGIQLQSQFSGGVFSVVDTGTSIDALTAAQIATLPGSQFSQIDSTSGSIHWSVAQFDAGGGDLTLHAVAGSQVVLFDTEANLEALTAAQIAAYGASGATVIDSSSDVLNLNVSQLDALATAAIALTPADTVELADTESHIEALSAAALKGYVDQGVDVIHAGNSMLNLNAAQVAAVLDNGASFAVVDTVQLFDLASNIETLTAGQWGELVAGHVDEVGAVGGTLDITVAEFQAVESALHSGSLTIVNPAVLADTGAAISGLTVTELGQLAGDNIGAIDATDGALALTVAQYTALGTVGLTAADTVTISDTAAHITTLDFSTLAAHNVDFLDVTDGFSLNVARYQSMGAVKFAPSDTITLADTGANLAAMSAVQFAALAGNGIDKIDASDNVLSLTIGRYLALGTVTLTASDVVTLADTGAHISALTVAQIGALAAGGIDKIDATDNTFSLTVAQYQALGTVTLTGTDTVTLADTGAHLQALTAAQIGALAGNGIDKIDATNNALSLSVAQYGALGTVALTGADSVTLLDTGANLETLNFSTLASKNVDILDASDNVLALTAAQFQALGTVSLKSSDTVTLLDTGADISALTVGQFNALAAKGIDVLDATDNVYSLSTAQVNGLGALTLAANDTVTMSDTEANIESETSGNFTTAATVGIDFIHSTNNTDHVTVAQITPLLGTTTAFAAGDTVTLTDTGANIATLSATQIAQLAAAGVDKIDATDNTVTLSVAQYRALGTVTLASGDTNTISDNDTNIDSLTTGELAGLAAAHVGAIHSSFTVVWSAAQWNALPGSVHVSSVFGASGVELIGSADVIDALTAAQISSYAAEGLGALQGFNGDLTLSVSQATTILANLIIVGNDDGIFLTDTGSAIAGLSTTQIGELAGAGFQTIDATDDALTLSVAQFQVLNGVALTAGDTVTVADTEANIEALSNAQLSAMRDGSVDIIHSTGGVLNVSTAQAGALLGSGTHFAYGDAVTLFDSGATISTLAPVQFSVLAAAGIDTIDASDNSLTLSLAQYLALGTVTLTQSDTVTIQDDNSILTLMTEADIQSLSSKGIDVLESFNGNFSFSVGQTEALLFQTGGGHVSLSGGDLFYVVDSGANISTLTAANLAAIGALGAGSVDLVGSGTITFSVAQYEAAVTAGVLIDSSDNVTLFDTGAALGGLTAAQIGALAGNGVDHIDVSDDAVTWSLAQVNALGTVTLTSADTYTVSDTEANIEALSNTQFSALISKGIDVFHSQSGSLSLSVAQVTMFLFGAHLDSANSVTLSDVGGNIAAQSAYFIGLLAGFGVDFIDATDDALTLSVAQYQALGTVQLSAGDTNTLSDTNAAFQGLSTTDIAGLDDQYISHLHSSDGVQWSLAQWNALASGITIDTAAGSVALYDTEAHDESLTVGQINNFHTAGLNSIVVTDTSTLDFTVAQTTAILNDGIVLSTRTGVVADTRANLAALTVVQIGELAAAGFRAIDSTNDLVNFNRAQVDALAAGHIALTLGDTVDMNVNETQMEAFTAAKFTAYMTQGVDIFQSASSTLAVNESQVVAVTSGGGSFRDGDAVTLADTASHIQSLKATEFGQLATTGVDIIDVTSGTLSLTVADYLALGAFTIVGGSVTLSDTSTNIESLTADQLAALTGTSISHIDASDNTLSLSVADVRGVLNQTNGGTVTFDATDALTITDTGANLGGLTAAELTALAGDGAGTVTLDASDNVLTISQAQYDAIVSGSIALAATDTVTLADTGADLAALSAAQLAALATNNVDAIDATDNAITLSIAQLDALHGANVALTPADTVTLSDTEANIEALTGSQLAGYATQGVDIFSAGDSSTLHLTASQVSGVLATSASFAAANNVSLVDSGANIAALSAAQFGQLAGHGVDHIDASDNVLALTAAQYSGLGTTTLTGSDTVTLSDTGAHIAGLTAAQFAAFAANGIDTIDASDNVLSLSVAQYQGLGTVTLTGTDVVTLADTGAHVSALTAVQIGQLAANGIDTIDTTNNVLSLNLSQVNALGTVTLASADTDTLADTGATLGAMSAAQFAALAGKGIDKIDATDNVLSLTIGRYNALGTVTLTASDTVTLGDTGAHLGALTAAQIGALASRGIDAIDATDNAITFSLAQYNALGSVHTAANDVITVNGTSGDDLISGTANSDVLNGGNGDDVLVGQGGNDTLSGGAGNNTLSGGAGTDTADYSWSAGGVTVNLLNGTANNGTGTDTLTSIENVTGSAGSDTITAGTGVNALSGGNGDDTFVFGPNLTAADQVDGGAGNDTVTLNGDYSAGITFTATTMVNVETLTLAAGHSYTLATVDATVAPGATMTVDGSALGALDVLTFTGTHETDGNYTVTGGAAADHISTGSGNDTINGGAGDDVLAPGSGNDTVNAGDGNDTIFMYGNLTAADHIDGGTGLDKVRFNGDYSGGVVLGATTITNVETFQFAAGSSYKITTNDATVASGQVLTVDASALGAGNTLTFNGSAETNGTFNITGGLGGDDLTGGAGADHFIYTSAAQSSSIHYDTIHNLDFSTDRIDVTGAITVIDSAVTSGSLSTATFDSDLASDMSGHLGVHHALMFTASSGTLAGDTFLVIDINGVAGYQTGQDIVIELAGHTGSLAVSDFI